MFNGNISETLWRTSADNIKRKYTYSYDDLNRLLNADYSKPGLTSVPNNYAESMSYDKNGNITALTRYGDLDSDGMVSANLIDELKYTYDVNNANLLKKVLDLSNNPQGFNETADIATGDSDGLTDQTDDYEYDANGNMVKDTNKSITKITYNHLNLPINLLFEGTTNGTISYLYNATGQKLRKKVVDATSLNTTDYLNGFQYTNTTLDFFPHAEGYVKYTLSGKGSGIYSYVFNYTDHLGNIRLSYGKDPSTNVLKVLEENHYYPFGLKHTNYNSDRLIYVKEAEVYKIRPVNTILPTYKYKYNGKELQEELGLNMYDYGARNYDPAIGRWMNVDPLAEQSRRWSPYNYTMNNPINMIDPDGRAPLDWIKWITSDGQKHLTFDANVTTVQQAIDKGYTNVKNVVASGCFYNTKDIYENYTVNESGNVALSNGSSFNVHNGDTYTTSDGTFINKNKTGTEQLLELCDASGDALTVLGLATLQPELVALGGLIGNGSLAGEVANDFNNQGINDNTLLKNGAKVGVSLGTQGLGDVAVGATKKVAGKKFVESGANKISESIIQGTVEMGGKAAEQVVDEQVKKVNQ